MNLPYSDITGTCVLAYLKVRDFYLTHPWYTATDLRKALAHELQQRGLRVQEEAPVQKRYRELDLENDAIDILVEDKIVLELKIAAKLRNDFRNQVLTYMEDGAYPVGLLFLFNQKEKFIKRYDRHSPSQGG